MASERPGFQEPGWFTRNVFNRVVAALTRLGLSVAGSRVLRVRNVWGGVLYSQAVGRGMPARPPSCSMGPRSCAASSASSTKTRPIPSPLP